MGDKSAIQWTDATWNPVTGCSKVSPGCAHCYAESVTERYAGRPGWIGEHRPWTPENAAHNVILHPGRLDQPVRWRRPRMVFVNSMSDLFHEQVPAEFILEVFRRMGAAHWHTYQILTKRPERMLDVLPWVSGQLKTEGRAPLGPVWKHVWLGVSIENRRFIHRAELLRQVPAAVRFISAEPLLGSLIDIASCGSCWDWPDPDCDECEGLRWWHSMESLQLNDIDWLIVGGESGARHRPMNPDWVRELRDMCEHTDTAFFFKQWGGRTPKSGGRVLDGRTWDEMPRVVASLERHP